MLLDDTPGAIGNGELENGLSQIHAHDRQSSGSIHFGFLLVDC
jgi:hypothetical protein